MGDAPAANQWTELISFADAGGEVRVAVNGDQTRAVMSVTRGAGTERPKTQTIQRLLRDKGVTKNIDANGIAAALVALQQPFASISDVVVARGVAAVHGRNGQLQAIPSLQGVMASPGDVVATVQAPAAGRDGQDVFARRIVAAAGKPLQPRLGSHVHLDASGNSVIATVAGFAVVVGDHVDVSPCFSVQVAPDGLSARVSFDDPVANRDDLKRVLAAAGIVFGLRNDDIDSAISEGRAGNLLVASGIRPMAGRDARLEYFFARRLGAVNDPAGENRAGSENPLAMFNAGEMLLRLQPAEEGVAGIDVFGVPIPVSDVLRIEIAAGDNVRQATSHGSIVYSAAARGAPFLENGSLRLSDELVVEGDLTPAIGNIEFKGSVRIKGDVPNGYRVVCERDLYIDGVVNEAHLCSGGDTTIDSGCMGAGKAFIKTAGTLKAKYIDHAQVESEGDVLIANELIASRIECLGRANLHRAVVRGGEICALGGIEVRILGSDDHLTTRVMAGEDFRLLRFAEECALRNQAMVHEIREISERLKAFRDGARALGGLNQADKEDFTEGLERIESITAARAELDAALQDRRSAEKPGRCAEIVINGHLHPGTHISIGEVTRHILRPVRGPMKIIENGEIEIVSPGSSR